VASAHWQRDVPDAIRALDTLERVDYGDLFTATAGEPVAITPERWARALHHGAPFRVRLILGAALLVQRRILGLRLERGPAATNMLGWRLAERGRNWFRLEAVSWMGEAHLLIHAEGRQVSIATLLRYDHRMSPLVWTPISTLHRQVGLALVRYAVSPRGMQTLRDSASVAA
jgi:hypothetical protein